LEYLQGRGEPAPTYEVITELGPDHDKTFKIAVHTAGKVTGIGIGQSKKEAEQRAAAASLTNLEHPPKI
jgi:ribonuclease-3